MIWDGNIRDTTNFVSNKFLQINSCGIQNANTNYTVIREHGRKDYHILFVENGEGVALHNGAFQELKAGSIVIYGPNEKQKYSFHTDGKYLWCHFSGTAVAELFQEEGLVGNVYHIKHTYEISKIFYTIIRYFHIAGREKFAVPLLLELLYTVSDAVGSREKKKPSKAISKVLLHIHANYNKPIALEDLARISGYSKSRFSHLFKEELAVSPKAYLNDIRLNASCEMLSSTNKSITEVSSLCGFDDPLYYSRIFKQKYNVTPSVYRQRSGK